jgi:hypothetical protein
MTSCTPDISSSVPCFDFAFVAGDADGGALRAGHGVGAIAERFDFLADGADLLFGGLRLHDYEHGGYPELFSLAFAVKQGKRPHPGRTL